jgi:hypothetical protein
MTNPRLAANGKMAQELISSFPAGGEKEKFSIRRRPTESEITTHTAEVIGLDANASRAAPSETSCSITSQRWRDKCRYEFPKPYRSCNLGLQSGGKCLGGDHRGDVVDQRLDIAGVCRRSRPQEGQLRTYAGVGRDVDVVGQRCCGATF